MHLIISRGWKSRSGALPAAALTLLCLGCGPSFGQAGVDPMTSRLTQVKSSNVADRTAASKFLIDDWTRSLEPLVKELSKFEATAAAGTAAQPDIDAMLGVTDTLRSILANKEKEGAIKKFREIDNDPKVISGLAWMARSDNRDIRVNSTYILANVIDNTNVCIVLDHLRDPSINGNGRVNLLQTIAPVAGYAYKKNVELIQKSLPVTKSNAKGDADRTNALVEQLLQRVGTSTNAREDLTLPSNCPSPGIAPLR